MIKLSKAQVDAISRKIYREISDECYRKDKIIKNEAVVKFLRTDVGKAVTKINSGFFTHKPLSDYNIESLAMEYFNIKFTELPNASDIANDIVVACIESDDINTLIETIKARHNVQENDEA
jgi:hypothetical protein